LTIIMPRDNLRAGGSQSSLVVLCEMLERGVKT